MPGQLTNLIDVVIVLIGLYILLSTICSFINEQIATFLKLRGKKLYLGVANLVSSKPLADAIFAHPAIDPSVNDQGGIQDRPGTPNRPSYMAPHNFAIAFWDSLANASIATPAARAAQAVTDAKAAVAATPLAAPRLQAANELLALRGASGAAGTGLLSDGAHFEDLRQVVENLPLGHLKSNALALLALAQEDYGKLIPLTEAWFDRQMEAVGGWYTRQARYIAILVGVIVVFITGLDTLEIAQRLYTTPAAVSVAADAISKAERGGAANTQQAVANAALAVFKSSGFGQFFHPCFEIFPGPCWIRARNPALAATDAARDGAALDIANLSDQEAKEKLVEDRDALRTADGKLNAARKGSDPKARGSAESATATLLRTISTDEAAAQTASDQLAADQRANDAHVSAGSHVVGWILTILAISLGAPFWFDVLNKLVNVRNAGQKPPTQSAS